jgi:glycosyltransferase involved in cell wall biosynthesis
MRNGRIVTCMVTHNRFEYTKQCLESYLDTTPENESFIIVVDNASTDETQYYLKSMFEMGYIDAMHLGQENKFPGAAVNLGWSHALENYYAPLLHRSDNDVEYQPGWLDYVEKVYRWDGLGQLGLLTFDENGGNGMENNPTPHPIYGDLLVNWHYGGNIGGVCVVSKTAWDRGVRYKELSWQPGANEDYWFSNDIRATGFNLWAVCDPIVKNLSKDQSERYPEYTAQTTGQRNIGWHWHKNEDGEWYW